MKKILSLLVFMIMSLNCALANKVEIGFKTLDYGTYNMYGGWIQYEKDGFFDILELRNVNIDNELYLKGNVKVRVSGNNTISNSLGHGISIADGSSVSFCSTSSSDVLTVNASRCAMIVGSGCDLNVGTLERVLTMNLNGIEHGMYCSSSSKVYITYADLNVSTKGGLIGGPMVLEFDKCVLTGGAYKREFRNSSGSFEGYIVECEGDLHVVALRETYDLKVKGVEVNNINAADVLGDGKVTYDKSSKKLILDGAKFAGGTEPAIESGIDELKIEMHGSSAISSNSTKGTLYSKAPFSLNGAMEGTSLTITNGVGPAIVNDGANVEIYNLHLSLEGKTAGIQGMIKSGASPDIYIHESTVAVGATTTGAIIGQKSDSWFNYKATIYKPYKASVKDGALVNSDNTVCKGEVLIKPERFEGIWLGETPVTEENASDVLGSGQISFNWLYRVLTLNGCTLRGNDSVPAIDSSLSLLKIKLVGRNTLTSGSPEGVIHSTGSFTITPEEADAEIVLTNINDGPCIVNEACDVRIEGVGVDMYGASGIQGKSTSQGDASLYISNSVVAYHDGGQAVSGQKKITLDGNETVKQPYYAVVKDGAVVDEKGNPVKGGVTFSPGQKYDIMVAGRQVNEFNKHDIMHEGKNGVQYDPKTNVLSVHGVNIETNEQYAIRSNVKGIAIQFDGGEVLTANRGSGIVLTYDGSITSLSPDPVTINAVNAGIAAGQSATVTLGDGKQPFSLNINSKTCGIQGTESPWVHSLKLDNATLSIAPTTQGAITGFSDIDLGGFHIVQDGARILNGSVMNYDGTRYCNQLDIADFHRYDIWLCGVRVTSDNCNDILGDGKAAYAPKTRTLTLTGTVRCDSGNLLMADGNLVLHGTGPVSLVSTDGYCIYGLGGDITIDGMNLTCESDCETVYMEGVGALQIFESSATFSSASSSALSLCDNDLFLSSSIVNVRGNGQEQTIDGCQNLMLDACILTSDNYYDASTRHFYNNASGEIETGDVTFTVKGESEPLLYVKGEPVTVRNAGDILHDGSMSYDPETKTLTLHGGEYVAGMSGYIKPLDDITIVCEAEVTVMVGMASSFVRSEHDVTFRSGYPVNLSGIGGTVFNLYGNLTLDVEEMTLIQGTDLLYANGEGGLTVDATGHPTSIRMLSRSGLPFVQGCLWIDLKECEFTSGEYNSRKQQIVGSTITDESAYYKYEATITSTAMPDAIDNVTPATHEAQTIYDLQGRRIPAAQAKHGLYIIDGRKVMR